MTDGTGPELDLGVRDPGRVVAFSDAVIAIAVTLLVLEIRQPDDTRHLFSGLGHLWPSYISCMITFMLIGQIWANHHVMFLHGLTFLLAAALFNLIWWYARRDRRLLADNIDSAGATAVARRFQLALAWLGVGTLVGAVRAGGRSGDHRLVHPLLLAPDPGRDRYPTTFSGLTCHR